MIDYSLLEQLPFGVVVTDFSGLVAFTNKYFDDLLHSQTTPFRNIQDLIFPENTQQIFTFFSDERNSKCSYKIELKVIFQSKSYLFDTKVSLLQSQNKEQKDILFLFSNIEEQNSLKLELKSQKEYLESLVEKHSKELKAFNQQLKKENEFRKRAEFKREESEKRYRLLFESSSDTMIIIDAASMQVEEVNPKAFKLLGYQEDELIGLSAREIFIDSTNARQEITNSVEEGNIHKNLLYVRKKDGDVIPIDMSPSIFSNNGKKKMIAIIRDMSSWIKVEEDLQKAISKAEAANKFKSQFLANMSHELRSPLNAIVGFSQILLARSKQMKLPKDFRKYLHNIKTGGQLLTEVINNILDLSKIEAGKMKINLETLNIRQLIRNIFYLNKSSALSKNIEYTYDFGANLPPFVKSDRTKLSQILMNLTANAIKFTPNGKRVIVRADSDENFLFFNVIDHGIGISKEEQNKIFSAFAQVDAEKNRKYGGTGLGLSITRKLIDLMNGEINLKSELGKGTEFIVKIPLIRSDEAFKDDELSDFSNFKLEESKKVLIIEDNKLNQEIIKVLLEDINLTVVQASNGNDGIEKAISENPDLILMDLHMPDMDGFQTIKKIRSYDKLRDIPIALVTADAFQKTKESSIARGFDAFVTKPVTVQKLYPTVWELLGKNVHLKENEMLETLTIDLKSIQQNLEKLKQIPIFQLDLLLEQIKNLKIISKEDAVLTAKFNEIELAAWDGNKEKLDSLIDSVIS